MKKFYTIPFFIPHLGCPFSCIFCGQKKISGRTKAVLPREIAPTIEKYIKTIPKNNTHREVAFFGGSFTAIPIEEQTAYLKEVIPFIKSGDIQGVRLSTRPDFIDTKIFRNLKKYNVNTIELGVQSMSEDVLKKAKRGHTAKDVKKASGLIKKMGFNLGHQLMAGLPGSSLRKEIMTAKAVIKMKADEVRIYPVIVVRGTALETMYRKGLYKPLEEEEAIARCAELVKLFRRNRIKVLRCGLHPSRGFLSGKDMIKGPFHEAFGQKVESFIYGEILKKFIDREKKPGRIKRIIFHPKATASVIGHKRHNAAYIERITGNFKMFSSSCALSEGELIAEYKNGKKRLLSKSYV